MTTRRSPFAWAYPKSAINDRDIDRGLRSLLYDGVFLQMMLVLSTGPFLIGLALALGASNVTIGLLAGVGPLAQVLQIPAIYLVEYTRLRKLTTILTAFISRSALFGIAFTPWLAPQHFAIPLFLIFLSLHFGAGAVAGCAYNSWLRDLIPTGRLAGFFAHRLTWSTFAGAILSFLGGMAVDAGKYYTGDARTSYAAVFVAAGAAGLVSLFFLGRTPEPEMPPGGGGGLWRLLLEPMRDVGFRQLVFFIACWSFAVNFAAPFFAVYLLDRLGLSMTWVLALSVVSQMTNVVFFGLWGRLADRFSNKSVLMFTVPVFFMTFLLWPFTTLPERHVMTIPLLMTIHIVGGMSAAGVALCIGNLALKSAPYGKGAPYLAVNALVSGIAATVAPLLAGICADGFAPYEARLTLAVNNWHKSVTEFELPTLDLRGLDFVFLLAFFCGLYCFHRLLAVKEEGEVTDRILRQALVDEMRRMVRQVSTAAGMRQVITFPLAFLLGLRRRV